MINYRIIKRTMSPHVLFETHFSNYHDQVATGIFDERAKDVVEVIDWINSNVELG